MKGTPFFNFFNFFFHEVKLTNIKDINQSGIIDSYRVYDWILPIALFRINLVLRPSPEEGYTFID